ncbi:MAG TPA: 4Fe-4S dicluster domain-containing protein [Methanosarcina sp.]|nr:4Fe-4S dicluster domain-containing protein [Methanosarcina sp.]
MKDLKIQPELCMGCRSCEIACAVAHSKTKALFSALGEKPSPKKRITVEHIPAAQMSIPITCRQCENAPCVLVCPTKALSQDADTGFVSHNPEHCVDCWTCSTVCPRLVSLYHLILVIGCWSSSMKYNHWVIGTRTEAGVKCDLCEGRDLPACVEACPTHALVFSEIKNEKLSLIG